MYSSLNLVSMKLKIQITVIILILNIIQTSGQINNEISLDSCIIYAKNNFSVLKNNKLNLKISELHKKNYSANYYPKLNFEAKASYQSQSIDLDINTAGLPPGVEFQFPVPPLDQYALTLNISQTIYDAGLTKHLKELESKKNKLQNLNNELSFFQIKKQINEIYFGILILQKTEEQILQSGNELKARETSLRSSVKNGLVTQNNLDLLSAKILILKQKLIEIQENINTLINSLSILTGNIFDTNTKFKVPKNIEIKNENNRAEMKIFNSQNDLSETNIKLLNSKRLPKAGAFAVGGYGNPGLTMIKDEWSPYFIIGAKLQWNIWDWNSISRKKQIIRLKETSIENQKSTFDQSVKIQTDKLNSEIVKYTKLLEYDSKIIELHKKICLAVSKKSENGTANSVDYISALNAKEQAAIQYEIHKLKLIKCKYDYLIVTGN